ncbi:ribosomal maturation YjgA family protein [Emticicia agri]|uniref:DUF2809 domain-containing protein n=1 Tax=Emticicia agri TaxID=2492393 RepID=A0A4V1ZCS2_9BACT|nr:DUF2809 domain-containing protein [Emticicia agri]RYU93650.1 DUF2809 domain-containing protein [Emticicia agri]
MFTFRRGYALLALIFFIIEVLIALYVHDAFVRPILGDYLVMFLMYCFVFAFYNTHFMKASIAVLLFAYLIETVQYFHFVQLMGLEKYKVLIVVLGSSFSWYDMLAYTLGFLTIVLIENRRAGATNSILKQKKLSSYE